MPRPKQRTPALRAHVLGIAVELLGRDGVAGFTARQVAAHAGTSTPAVYELFGAKGGLVRAVFFEGFRRLHVDLTALEETDDPRADLVRLVAGLRRFIRANPVLADVMFSRPFVDFDPGPEEAAAGAGVRQHIVGRVRRAIDAGLVAGDATDVAHVLLALAQGLAGVEVAGWLGTSTRSVERRWRVAVDALLRGLAPDAGPAARRRPATR